MVFGRLRGGLGSQLGLSLPNAGKVPVVTWVLLAANVVIWLAATFAGGTEDPEVLLDFGAMFGPLIADGQYWRLFTAMFLHVGIAHLFFNGFGLFIFGPLLENAYGRSRVLLIYVLAGLSGSVASFLLNSISIGAGASGAIFGIMGALAAFFLAQRETLGEMARGNLAGLLVLAGINLLYGLSTPGIDNWAHVGGFASGFGLGLAFAPTYKLQLTPFGQPVALVDVSSVAQRWWVLPMMLVALLLGTWLAVGSLPDNPYTHVYRAERLFERQDFDAANRELMLAFPSLRSLDSGTRARAIALLVALRSRG